MAILANIKVTPRWQALAREIKFPIIRDMAAAALSVVSLAALSVRLGIKTDGAVRDDSDQTGLERGNGLE